MPGDVQPVDGSSLQTFSNDEISVVCERVCPNVTLLMVLKFSANQADHIFVSLVHGNQFTSSRSEYIYTCSPKMYIL